VISDLNRVRFFVDVVLPVGSFYTFHGLSYVIDIYYKIKAEYNFVDYSFLWAIFRFWLAYWEATFTASGQGKFDYEKAKQGAINLYGDW
jgi:hypothetical protein